MRAAKLATVQTPTRNGTAGSVHSIRTHGRVGRGAGRQIVSLRVFAKRKDEPLDGRPDPRDVLRLSRGEKALRRGTGSRDVAHRLNAEEAKQFEVAQRRRFVVLKGDGYRRERRGSPLCNTWRQWADAFAWPAVQVRQGSGGQSLDTVVIDLSTLRTTEDEEQRVAAKRAADAHGCPMVREDIPAGELSPERDVSLPGDGVDALNPSRMARLEDEIQAAGAEVVRLKAEFRAEAEAEGGSVNRHPSVQAAVAKLKQLKARRESALEAAEEAAEAEAVIRTMAAEEADCRGAIWGLRPVELHFEATDRANARALAVQLAAELCPDRPSIKI